MIHFMKLKGTNSENATKIVGEVNYPFYSPIYITGIRSVEIKYVSNTFLAMKISFINKNGNIL